METVQFIKQLRDNAKELKPLAQSALPNSTIWDGMNYMLRDRSEPSIPMLLHVQDPGNTDKN